ncbi:MAG: hypothetical protein TECD_01185 [Hyphomicrobiaceae bacterium hypho_1]
MESAADNFKPHTIMLVSEKVVKALVIKANWNKNVVFVHQYLTDQLCGRDLGVSLLVFIL